MNSSFFQLHPLSISYKYDIPTDAIDCSKSALDILHAIYQKAEYCLEDCKFLFSSFFFFLIGTDICGYIDYHLSLNGFSIPFIRFDNTSDEFVFVMKTKSFVKDDCSFGIFFFFFFRKVLIEYIESDFLYQKIFLMFEMERMISSRLMSMSQN